MIDKQEKFKWVGDCEQGGYLCSKCRHCNNPYGFNGKCSKCGHEEKNFDRFERH